MRFACITLFLVSFFMIDVAAAQGCAKQGRGSCNGPFCNVICCATNAYIGTCSTTQSAPEAALHTVFAKHLPSVRGKNGI